MGSMLLFWVVYGAWMVFTWTAVVGVLVILTSKVVEWITDGDYSLERYVDWFKHVVEYHIVSFVMFVIGGLVTFGHSFVFFLDTVTRGSGRLEVLSFHEFAVIISEWVSTTLQTPLLLVLTITGVVVLLKKGYPLFKKIKTLTDSVK